MHFKPALFLHPNSSRNHAFHNPFIMPAASVFLSQSSIDGVIRMPGSMMDKFSQLAGKVFKNGVTWDKIILLFYVAGRMAIKVCVTVCANNTDQPPAIHRPKKQHKSAHNHPNYMVHNYLNVCVCVPVASRWWKIICLYRWLRSSR